MREFLKNYWVSITLVLCTVAVLTVEFLIFPLWSEFFGVGYFVILLAILLLSCADDSYEERAWTTFRVLSFIAPLLQMGVLMYLFPTEIWFPIIGGGFISCIGGPYLAWAVPIMRLMRRVQRGLRDEMEIDAKQFRIEHEAFLARRKEKQEKAAAKKRYSYQGKPVSHLRSKIVRVEEEVGGYTIYLECGARYYIFKHWLKRKGKKMLSSPKIGNYATLYYSAPSEGQFVVACYISGKCRYKADGFEEH